MIIKMNVQILCEDLNQLLKDICDFLNNQVNDDNLTESQRLFANRLVQRSKNQLQQISQVSMALSADVDDSSYVDMNKQSVPPEEAVYEEGENNEYTPIVCADAPKVVCPYELLPAIEIEKCEKFGHLDRKSRFLFIGHQKRLFAGVKDHWLLLYGTKKDARPLDNLNLSSVVAKPLEGIKMRTFELTCKTSLKTFQFVAQTPKDMAQWVACINKRSSSTEQTNDITHSADDKDEENFYEPLKINEDPKDTLKKTSKPLPPLPRTPENTYVSRNPKSELPTPEMESYDPVITREPQNTQEVHKNVEQEEIYDFIENVVKETPKETQTIRKPLPPTPSAHPKLAEIQQQSSRANSFSEDEEKEPIYDTLEQPPPPQSTTRSKRPPDPEPEEEYCDLRSDESNHVSEPEEEYCNLITIQSSLRRKIGKQSAFTAEPAQEPEEEYHNITSIGTFAKSPINVSNSQTKKQEVEEPTEEYLVPTFTDKKVSFQRSPLKQVEDPEPEEQYDNITSIRASVEKPPTLPKSPMKQIRPPKPSTNNKQPIEKPGEEYLLPLQRSPLKQAEEPEPEPEEQYDNITSIRPNLPKQPMRNEEIKEPDEEYLLPNLPVIDKKGLLPRPPLKPKPNVYKPKVEMKVENEDEECEYDCVISHPNSSTTTNTRTNTTNKSSLNRGIGFFNTHKSKKEAPITTPKFKPLRKP